MKKISTLFKKNSENLGVVVDEVDPNNEWVFKFGIPTRKRDGTSCAIIDGVLYKRFDLKKGRVLPKGAIPCQEADLTTGHHPHWVVCDRVDKSNKYHFMAFDKMDVAANGTYELCGEKVQGNPEKIEGHTLIRHGSEVEPIVEFDFYAIKKYLEAIDVEGIVFHHKEDDRMCKIRKTDFGIKR